MKMNKEVVMVRISDIIPNRFQPRLTFDEEALNELANSIKEHGIIQPLILRDLGSKYEIIAGERRYKASQLAGLTEVPAIVGSMDDQTSAELALIENIQRKDLTAIEEAKSYKIILDMGSFTQEQLAKRMGKSQSTVANKMRLLSLTNEVQMALMNNLISERHARCLLQIKDSDKQKEVLNKIINERMNVRDTDDYIKNMLGIPKVEMPAQEKEINVIQSVQTEKPIVEENVMPMNNINLSTPIVELPKSETVTSMPVVDTPKIEEPIIEQKAAESTILTPAVENENPNIYKQSNNIDVVDITSLSGDTIKTSPVKSALSGLNIINTDSEVFGGTNTTVEEKVDTNIQNVELTMPQNNDNNILNVKLATAIKLAKDSVEEIKKAGYNVKMEEIDTGNDYQIIIKVEK